MSKNNRKTKSLLINPKFQLNVIRYFITLFLMVGVANIVSVYYFFHTFKTQGFSVGLSPDHVFFRFVHEQEITLYMLMGGALFVSLIILCIGGFNLSHKVAGPLYRLTQDMRSFSKKESKLRPVRFRKGDYFLELQDTFNDLVETINEDKSNNQLDDKNQKIG